MFSSAMGFTNSFWSITICLCKQLVLFRGSHEIPFANYSIRCNLFLQLESSFSEESCPVGALLALLFGDSIGEHTHIYTHVRVHEASRILSFLKTLKWILVS